MTILKELAEELDKLAAKGRRVESSPVQRKGETIVEYRGRALVDFTNWDFLGLGSTTDCKRAAQKEIERSGASSNSPRLLSGTLSSHLLCERRLAAFLQAEDVLFFSSRNQAVISLLATLLQEGDLILAAEELQSPVADAAYLVNADCILFPPDDLNFLERELVAAVGRRRLLLFVETVQAGSGALSRVPQYIELLKRFPAEIILDETFALGALGLRGAGSMDCFALEYKPLARIGDLAAGLAGYGAFIAGTQSLTAYLLNMSRTFRAEAALPAAVVEPLLRGLDLVELRHAARERIILLRALLRKGFQDLGFLGISDSPAPLFCVPLSSVSTARKYQQALLERGFLVEFSPRLKVFSSEGFLRLIVHASHTVEQIEALLRAVSEIRRRVEEGL